MMSSSDVFWLALALVGPLLWVPVRSLVWRRRRERRNRTFVRGGAHGKVDYDEPATPSSWNVATWCWSLVVSLWTRLIDSIRQALEERRHSRQTRVTFAEHSTGEVLTERYHFHSLQAPVRTVVPEIHTPSPVVVKRPERRLVRTDTPPPKFLQAEKENKATRTPPDHRALVVQAYRSSPFLARSTRAIRVPTTPLSVQYQQQNRKRSHQDSAPPSNGKRQRIPLTAITRRRSSDSSLNSKKRNRASTEAWLLEEFNRKRRVNVETPVTNPSDSPTTNASPAATKPTFVFGVAETGAAAPGSKDDAKPGFSFGAEASGTTIDSAAAPLDAKQPAFSTAAEASLASAPDAARAATSATTSAPATSAPFVAMSDKPAFVFGAATGASTLSGDAKPAFGTAASSPPITTQASAVGVSFGGTPATAARSTPAVSFGGTAAAAPTNGMPTISFGGTASAAPTNSIRAVSFGGTAAAAPTNGIPVASFGGSVGTTPAPSFGTSPSFDATPSFGATHATFSAGAGGGASARRRAKREAGRRR